MIEEKEEEQLNDTEECCRLGYSLPNLAKVSRNWF
jgi:hypothetical protein